MYYYNKELRDLQDKWEAERIEENKSSAIRWAAAIVAFIFCVQYII